VPILPLRINFLLYTRDFINSLRGELPTEKPVLIDLGCGPVAIVSVLAHRLFAWRSLPIEPNACSAQLARQNLIDNGIGLSVVESDQLPSARELEGDTAYVVVCNPPWFSGEANHEKECDGGEVAFSRRLISDCLEHQNIIAICLLIGQKSSVSEIVKTAKSANMTVSTVKMDQGHKCRHFVACSRLKQQNDQPVKRDSVKQTQRRKNRPLRGSVPLAKESNLRQALTDTFNKLEIDCQTLLATETCYKYALSAKLRTWPNRKERHAAQFKKEPINIDVTFEVRIDDDKANFSMIGENTNVEMGLMQFILRSVQN